MLNHRIIPLLASAALLGAAAKPPSQPSFWAQQPSAAERQSARAAAGVKPGAEGRAAVTCKAKADGALEACRIAVETPGFGAAILALAPLYRVDMARPRAPKAGDDVVIADEWYAFDTGPDWMRKPTGEDLLAVWPVKALARGEGGQATINCLVSAQGALYECAVVSEKPAGEHFGDAALALAPQFLMKPAMRGGQPVISAVSIPINFQTPSASPGGGLVPSRGLVSAAMAWPEAPSYADVAAAYPAKAKAAGLGGRATLNCDFNKEGRLTHCDTITEEPKRQGFGDAAKQLAKQFRAFPTLSNGKSVNGASVQLPVVFDPAMLAAGRPVIGKAQWAGLPSAEDTSAAFGKLTATGTVRVQLDCVVVAGGAVSDCRVEREEPAGQGVGAAALSLTPHFRLTTWTSEGLPTVGGTVGIPLRYEPAKADPPAKG